MNKISKINLNGKEYSFSVDERDLVIERNDLGDGSEDIIFIGLMRKADIDKPITYSYLSDMLAEDNLNNKVFAPTMQPITVRTNYKDSGGRCYFILVPENHANLYSLSNGTQCFTNWDNYTIHNIDFPKGSKPYKLFRFPYVNYFGSNPMTYTF